MLDGTLCYERAFRGPSMEPPDVLQTCDRCGEYFDECRCEQPEREAVPFGYEEYEPSPYDGNYSED